MLTAVCRTTTAAGIGLLAIAVLGIVGSWDDAAMAALVVAIKPTNDLYDGFRIWVSVLVFGGFLTWVGFYLSRHYQFASSLPNFKGPILWGASILITPLYLLSHHGVFGIPESVFAEDGLFEYLTVVILLIVAGMAAVGMVKGRAWLNGSERALLVIFIFGLIFLAGEEASWGQRIIGIETPPSLREKNFQGELNVHNLFLGWNEILRMVIACLLSAIVILLHRDAVPFLSGRLDILKPDDRFFWFPLILIPSHLYDEWFEQVVSFAILSYGVMLYRNLTRARRLAG